MLEELFSIRVSKDELEFKYELDKIPILEELFNIRVSNEELEFK